jgi:hypothetical protein
MTARHDVPDDHPDATDEANGLASIERPADDPQTRPALDPEVGLVERETPEDA